MTLSLKSTALFYVIENKNQLIKETKKSIYHIINQKKWINNINIFLVTPTNLVLTDTTKKEFTKIYNNIFFIEENCTVHTDHVFFNMIYGADLAERKIPKKFTELIYIDCDMFLIKDIPTIYNEDIIIEVEDKFDINNKSAWLIDKNNWFNLLNEKTNYYINTEFMIVNRKLNIFSKWLNTFESLYKKLKILEKTNLNLDISAMEESSFEITQYKYFLNKTKIKYMTNVVARLNDPVIIPKNKEDVIFISFHINGTENEVFNLIQNNFQNYKYYKEIQ